jgi:hypothetical protein
MSIEGSPQEANSFVLKDSGCEESLIEATVLKAIYPECWSEFLEPSAYVDSIQSATGHQSPVIGKVDLNIRFQSIHDGVEDTVMRHCFLVTSGDGITRRIILGSNFLQSNDYKVKEDNQIIELKPAERHYVSGPKVVEVEIFYKGQQVDRHGILIKSAYTLEPWESRWCDAVSDMRNIDEMTLYEIQNVGQAANNVHIQPMVTYIKGDETKVLLINSSNERRKVPKNYKIGIAKKVNDEIVADFKLRTNENVNQAKEESKRSSSASVDLRYGGGSQPVLKTSTGQNQRERQGYGAISHSASERSSHKSVDCNNEEHTLSGVTKSGRTFEVMHMTCHKAIDSLRNPDLTGTRSGLVTKVGSRADSPGSGKIKVTKNNGGDPMNLQNWHEDIKPEDMAENSLGPYIDLEDTREPKEKKLKDRFNTSNLNKNERVRLLDIALDFPTVWAKSKLDIGCIPNYSVKLDTDGTVFSDKFRPFPKGTKDIIMTILETYLDVGIFAVAPQSPYAMNMFLVRKPIPPDILEQNPDAINNPEYFRCLLDGRSLNRVTRGHSLSLGQFEDLFLKIGNAKYVILVDIVSAFFNIKIREEDQVMTSFYTPIPGVKYMFTVLPQGLKNSQVEFCSLINRIFRPIEASSALYVDDVALFSDTFEGICEVFRTALSLLKENGIKLLPHKTSFLPDKIKFVGVIWNKNGRLTIPEAKIQAFSRWPIPLDTKRKIQSFCSAVQFFRKFIFNLSGKMKPLTEMLKKDRKIVWTEKEREAFRSIVDALKESVILHIPKPGSSYTIHCDASKYACAARLCFIDEDKEEKLVACSSRTFSETAAKFSTFHQELLGLIFSIRSFEGWIAFSKCIIYVDCISLTYLALTKNSTPSIMRISIYLSQFGNFTYVHVRSKNNMADSLTRNVHQKDEVKKRTIIKPLTQVEAETLLEQLVIPDGRRYTEVEVRQLLAAFPLPSIFTKKVKCKCQVTIPAKRGDLLSVGLIESYFDESERDVGETLNDRNILENIDITRHSECNVVICENSDDEGRKIKLRESIVIAMSQATLDGEQMKRIQAIDPYCMEEMEKLENGEKSPLYLENGVLYVKAKWEGVEFFTLKRPVLPEVIFASLMFRIHSSLEFGAHGGSNLTEKTLREKYYFPNLKERVSDYCKECIWCQMGRDYHQPKSVTYGNLRPSMSRQMIAIDLAFSFPRTTSGEVGIMIMVDLFSAYTIAIPIRTKESSELLKVYMRSWELPLGKPEYIRSDGESGICKGEFALHCTLTGIKQVPCSSGASWVNSAAEKKIHILKDQLRAMQAGCKNPQAWEKLIMKILYVNNSTVRSGRFTPSELMFGQKIMSPYDVMNETHKAVDLNDYMKQVTKTKEQITKLQNEHLKSKFEKAMMVYNEKKVTKPFKENELVWLKNIKIPSLSGNALNPKYLGPYRVMKIIDNVTAMVIHTETGVVLTRHFNFLKPVTFSEISVGQAPEAWDIDLVEETRVGPRRSERRHI